MVNLSHTADRRPSVDRIVDHLYGEITSLRLLPGAKISEAEIAAKFGVSRQPVRDAFSRLENMDLLLIRPQKATEVRRFSSQSIEKARFVRAAVEAEVLRRAAAECDEAGGLMLDLCLALQRKALKQKDHAAFGDLDYDFHRTLCEIAKVPFAFDVISTEKAKVDRLCMLSLSKEDRMPLLIADHERIASCIKDGNAEEAAAAGMLHLTRLDDTIEAIRESNEPYFEDDDA